MLSCVSIMRAQPGKRLWTVSYTGSPLIRPVATSNPEGVLMGRRSEHFSLVGEYYFSPKWSAEVGYFRTNIDYGHRERTMEGLDWGVKRYFLDEHLFFQPYISAKGQFNWGRRFEWNNTAYEGFTGSSYMRNPFMSVGPGVGADFYLFSSLAFVVRYNFMMGIHSKTRVNVHAENDRPFRYEDRGMYHNLELGLKVTFPFHFSEEDGWTLYLLLLDLFFQD